MRDGYKKGFAEVLVGATELAYDDVYRLLETPPGHIDGEIAFPCFCLSKKLKKSPAEIATDLAGSLVSDRFFFLAVGPYVNACVDASVLAHDVLFDVVEQGDDYGRGEDQQKLVLIESPGPNTNKPLHLGHVRNMLLGESIASILRFGGYDVKKVDIVNDRGVHICKSMLAYDRWGEATAPNKKTDHFVGDWYVRYAQELKTNPDLEQEIQSMLQRWEAGHEQTVALWTQMRQWCLDGFAATFARYGVTIDKAYYESDIYTMGRDIIQQGVKDGVFVTRDDGAIVFPAYNDKVNDKVLLRSDGTSVYITQDIALAKMRYDERAMDRMVYVVAHEQSYHFAMLFAVLQALGCDFAQRCHHLAYGMVFLPDGKMKSREGNVVDADTLADDMQATALVQLQERFPDLSQEEQETRADMIAMAAIKFFVLNHDPVKDFVFYADKSLAFEGETGPYIQYTYARCAALCAKGELEWDAETVKIEWPESTTPDRTGSNRRRKSRGILSQPSAKAVLVQLAKFESVIAKAAVDHDPSQLTRYLFGLAQLFNVFYQDVQVLCDDFRFQFVRLCLVASVQQVLKTGLKLLGIEVMERM